MKNECISNFPKFNSQDNDIINNNIFTKDLKEEFEQDTRSYMDGMKKGQNNILVAIRCRPLSFREKNISNIETIKVLDEKIVILMDPIEYNGPNSVFKNRSREQTYAFDYAFDKTTNQHTVLKMRITFYWQILLND